MKVYGGVDVLDPYFLDLGTSWSLVVSFTPRPHYPPGKERVVPIG
jgi:hypothetical protein